MSTLPNNHAYAIVWNNGKIRLMDAYDKISPTDRLDIFVGQERVPFSVDASRELHEYMFSDLSFGANYLGNLRSVGVKFVRLV